MQRIVAHMWMQIQIFLYLITQVKHDEAIIVYHSLGYTRAMIWAKRLKRFRLILEAEEIYQDVMSFSRGLQKAEYRLFGMADAYIFPTELLQEKLNQARKPSAIIYGTYRVDEDRNSSFGDDRVHIVYAGTFDPRKGGAAAAAAAAFLDESYHIHIIGFGSERDKRELLRTIEETQQKSKCRLTYDGLLSGEEYIRFIQSCDIGLSTQNPDAAFNATSYPSKVLSYMANGLRVVSIRIDAVEQSAVGDLITYYDEQTAESIAKAIRSVDCAEPYDSRARIRELDVQFGQDIKGLIEAVDELD